MESKELEIFIWTIDLLNRGEMEAPDIWFSSFEIDTIPERVLKASNEWVTATYGKKLSNLRPVVENFENTKNYGISEKETSIF